MTDTIEQVNELVSMAERNGVRAAVVQQHLYTPAMREQRQRFRDEKFGVIRGVGL